jgi:UDP-glucose 4-epimerase
MIRCLITGGAGFIGSHLAEAAVSRGWAVTVLDNLSSGRLENLAPVLNDVTFIEGDVTDAARVRETARGCEVIFHEAALVSVPRSVADPRLSAEINDLGTLNVFEAARNQGVRRVVLASSAAVYGKQHAPPHEETLTPEPATPYAAHKLLGEHYARFYAAVYGIESVCLRYFNIYGPRQDPSSPYSGVISIFADLLGRDETPTLFGDGLQTRDFVYVSDVVRANFLAAAATRADGYAVNVATGRAVTILDLWRTMAALADRPADHRFGPARTGDIVASWGATSLAEYEIGFKAEIGLDEGLRKLLAD